MTTRAYYQKHREQLKSKERERYWSNVGNRCAQMRDWYWANAKRRRVQMRDWHRRNKKKKDRKKRDHDYYIHNRETRRAYHKQYRQVNRKKLTAQHRAWRKKCKIEIKVGRELGISVTEARSLLMKAAAKPITTQEQRKCLTNFITSYTI